MDVWMGTQYYALYLENASVLLRYCQRVSFRPHNELPLLLLPEWLAVAVGVGV